MGYTCRHCDKRYIKKTRVCCEEARRRSIRIGCQLT